MTQNTILSGKELPPKSGNAPKQLIFLLHGVGADCQDLFPLADELAIMLPDAYFISLDAPDQYDMAPIGRQWFSLQDRSTPALRDGIKGAQAHLNRTIEQKMEEMSLEESQVGYVGFSQGAMVALYTALRRPNPCGALISYSGALVDTEGLEQEILSRPSICLIHGEADMVVPFVAFEEAYQALQKLEVPVLAYSREELAHGIDSPGLQIGAAFLRHSFGLEETDN